MDGGKETAAQLDPARGRFVFGLHHHGLYPLGGTWLGCSPPRAHPSRRAACSDCVLRCASLTLCRSAHPPPTAGAGYLPLLPAFRRLVSVRPTVLTASVCVIVPLLRDIVLWLGVRIVSRRTFEHTLAQRGAVLICPGAFPVLLQQQQRRRWGRFRQALRAHPCVPAATTTMPPPRPCPAQQVARRRCA